VAQTLHWFNFDAFFNKAKRVLKPRVLKNHQLDKLPIEIPIYLIAGPFKAS